jgi:hypothetical protein
VWGVAGVEAEAELLSSAVTALTAMGLTHKDVVFKVFISQYFQVTFTNCWLDQQQENHS